MIGWLIWKVDLIQIQTCLTSQIPPIRPVTSHLKPVTIFKLYSLKIHFNIIPQHKRRFPQVFSFFQILGLIYIRLSFPHAYCMSRQSQYQSAEGVTILFDLHWADQNRKTFELIHTIRSSKESPLVFSRHSELRD
jgi:hypothetical protein